MILKLDMYSLWPPRINKGKNETINQDNPSSPGLDRRISSSVSIKELTLNRRGGITCERWVYTSLIPAVINITHPATTGMIALVSDPVANWDGRKVTSIASHTAFLTENNANNKANNPKSNENDADKIKLCEMHPEWPILMRIQIEEYEEHNGGDAAYRTVEDIQSMWMKNNWWPTES